LIGKKRKYADFKEGFDIPYATDKDVKSLSKKRK